MAARLRHIFPGMESSLDRLRYTRQHRLLGRTVGILERRSDVAGDSDRWTFDIAVWESWLVIMILLALLSAGLLVLIALPAAVLPLIFIAVEEDVC